ncbi:class I SAM-dependent methyltransferase [Euzebya rosea]|uniref:class I SAM-dependent methyltransferase n=1 Tax=Euzebya rosea TaxID=2052804 RepID=UPI000D3E8FA2|nr:class I SAM-dependent methyltransferase [Euzebya rosea]
MAEDTFDRTRSRAFSQRLMSMYGEAMLTNAIALGARTGLTAAFAEAPGTSAEIAARAGMHERYVREWLHALVVGGVAEHADGTFSLPPEHAISLTGDSFLNTTAIAAMAAAAGGNLDGLAHAFTTGEGTPFHDQAGDMPAMMDRLSRARYETFLIDSYLGQVDGLAQDLDAGIRVADIGCGTGRVALLIATAFPDSRVTGIDLSAPSIATARAAARDEGVDNVTFVEGRIDQLDGPQDLITAFDVIHDLGHPAEAVAHVRSCLADGGRFVMCDSAAPASLDAQAELPWAPMMYGLSMFGCVGTARSQGGEGLGNMWGQDAAVALLRDAGFGDVEVLPAKGDPMNAIYVATG